MERGGVVRAWGGRGVHLDDVGMFGLPFACGLAIVWWAVGEGGGGCLPTWQ